MRYENRDILRRTLIGKTIKDLIFHDSHGLVIDILLENGDKVSVTTYEDESVVGDFFVGLNDFEL